MSSVTLHGGLTLPYVEQGDPSGIPMVMLHGYSDSSRSFDLLLPELPEHLHAFAVTQRGHGDADRPAEGYRPDDYVADLLAFLDAMGIGEAIVVGHSGGSLAARRFAAEHPERTLGVALLGAFASFADNPSVAELSGAVAALTDPVDPAFVREFQESCVAGPIPDGFLDGIVAESLKLPARVWHAYLRGLLESEPPGALTVPGLLLWGDQDGFASARDQEDLQAAIPGSRLAVYPGVGHCPHWEEPAAVAGELEAFARERSVVLRP